jgi:hypothetical protein
MDVFILDMTLPSSFMDVPGLIMTLPSLFTVFPSHTKEGSLSFFLS